MYFSRGTFLYLNAADCVLNYEKSTIPTPSLLKLPNFKYGQNRTTLGITTMRWSFPFLLSFLFAVAVDFEKRNF